MYCKHCGSLIADNSVFCAKCGKLVVEAYSQPDNQTPETNEPHWIPTNNLQWKRPVAARYVQIALIVILGWLTLYPTYCALSGEKLIEWYDKSFVKPYGFSHHDGSIDGIPIGSLFIVVFPFIALIVLTNRWRKRTRFPGKKDIVPRDVADEVEQYEWDGFNKEKFVFYKKDGKFGVIDARNYCVSVPAQYDSIVWRMPNKTFDATIGEEKITVTIPKTPPYNPNKKSSALELFA